MGSGIFPERFHSPSYRPYHVVDTVLNEGRGEDIDEERSHDPDVSVHGDPKRVEEHLEQLVGGQSRGKSSGMMGQGVIQLV